MSTATQNGKRTNGAATAIVVEPTVVIEVPFAPLPEQIRPDYEMQQAEVGVVAVGPIGLHVNVQLGTKAACGFMRLRNGLRAHGAKLQDGRPVWTNADTLRYLLEGMVDASM